MATDWELDAQAPDAGTLGSAPAAGCGLACAAEGAPGAAHAPVLDDVAAAAAAGVALDCATLFSTCGLSLAALRLMCE